MKLTTPPYLVLILRICGVIFQFPIHLMASRFIKHRDVCVL
jgi:hypothetical protein